MLESLPSVSEVCSPTRQEGKWAMRLQLAPTKLLQREGPGEEALTSRERFPDLPAHRQTAWRRWVLCQTARPAPWAQRGGHCYPVVTPNKNTKQVGTVTGRQVTPRIAIT